METGTSDISTLIAIPGGLILAAAAGLAVVGLVTWLLRRITRASDRSWDDPVVEHTTPPARLLGPVLAVLLFLPVLGASDPVLGFLRHALSLTLIAGIGWFLARATRGFREAILGQYDLSGPDNLKARAVHTQVDVVSRIVLVLIVVITVASMVMTFERVRQVGVSLLASAGLIGIIVGFAAQKSLSTFFAGIQIALTQPIRIDDVVIVEGEFGRIEEITLTYVVVRTWDLRRLVVPISYFIEKPFQNWTRVGTELLGTVTVHVDYHAPLEAMRKRVKEILDESPHWDGKVWNVQVTDSSDRDMDVRVLLSGADSGRVWNLRCEVREKLLAWLAEQHPENLPRTRTERAALSTDET